MADTPERRVKKEVEKVLDANDVYYFYPSTHGYGRSGVPDIIACVAGKFLAIETKAAGKEATALQKREMKRIHDAGGVALEICGLEEVPVVLGWVRLLQRVG